ncbi:hypothetical protein TNCV_3551691 [Trichonephila clavipes]|nr:hypothetical protein TNCV_3551691 [Trichonephila clavipes]
MRFPHPSILASVNRKQRESGSGHLKSLVYVKPVLSVENLNQSVAVWRISDMPGIFENVKNSLQHHCQVSRHNFWS